MKNSGNRILGTPPVPFLALALNLALTLNSSSVLANSIVLVPTLGGTRNSATDLNNVGQVVGFSTLAGDQLQHAFLFSGGTVVDLGTLGGLSSQANGLNDLGQVFGQSDVSGGGTHAFRYESGLLQDLDTLGGSISAGNDINQAGHVVGYAFLPGNSSSHAFLYNGTAMVDLGTLGGSSSSATAINNLGEVAGDSSTANGQSHPFLYRNGTMTSLGTLGGTYGIAWDLNDAGVVVGESETAQSETHGFVYVGGVMVDLGTLGGSFSFATAVNEAGQVIGDSYTQNDAEYHAFLYAGGTLTDLGTFGGTYSSALAINQAGQIVGDASDVTEMTYPFLWENGVMVDLNTLLPPNSGWELWSAFRINDAGQILGYGLTNGQFRYYLLSLQSQNRPPVAQAGPDQSLQCPGSVTLNGTGSSDPDGDALTYAWSLNGVALASGANPTVSLPAGSHVLQLTVSDPAGASSSDTVQVAIADTQAPSVSCPLSRSATAGADCTAPVPDLTASVVAVDNCASSGSLQRSQVPPAGTRLGVGSYDIVVTVADPSGNSASCTTRFDVTDATPPEIFSCPTPVSVEAGDNNTAPVPNFTTSLGATDNCAPVSGLTVVQSPLPGTMVGPGTHEVTITVTDAAGNSASCATTVTVVAPPPCQLVVPSRSATPSVLWPANGKMVAVAVTVHAESGCGDVVSKIVGVRSNEPETDPQDIEVTGNLTLNLRAERAPQGDGRVYSITVESVDAQGNHAVGVVQVDVPRKKSEPDLTSTQNRVTPRR